MWLTKRNMQIGKKSKELNMFCPSRNGWIRWHFQQGFQAKFLLTYSCHVVGCSLIIPFGNLKTGHTGGGSLVEIKGSEHVAPKYYGFGSDCCKQDRVSTKTTLVFWALQHWACPFVLVSVISQTSVSGAERPLLYPCFLRTLVKLGKTCSSAQQRIFSLNPLLYSTLQLPCADWVIGSVFHPSPSLDFPRKVDEFGLPRSPKSHPSSVS